MAQTVADVIKMLSAVNQDTPIKFYYWTADEIGQDQSNGFEVTPAHAVEILDEFEFGDYTWESANEDWNDAVNTVLSKWKCEECWEYHYGSMDIEGVTTCPDCGEESDVLYEGDTTSS